MTVEGTASRRRIGLSLENKGLAQSLSIHSNIRFEIPILLIIPFVTVSFK